MTEAAKIPVETRQRLRLLLDKYLAPKTVAPSSGKAGA
jgi:hypothetical protein